MILVDTTVVIDYTRGKDLKLQALLLALPVAVCGLTRTEVLHGSRGPADRQKLGTALIGFLPPHGNNPILPLMVGDTKVATPPRVPERLTHP